jgi:hypothetical protein
MNHFATPHGESSPAEAALSALIGQHMDSVEHFAVLLLVVNHSVIVRLVPINRLGGVDRRWAR